MPTPWLKADAAAFDRLKFGIMLPSSGLPASEDPAMAIVERDTTPASNGRRVSDHSRTSVGCLKHHSIGFSFDRRGTLTHISPSSEAILGYRPGETIGHSGGLHLSRGP